MKCYNEDLYYCDECPDRHQCEEYLGFFKEKGDPKELKVKILKNPIKELKRDETLL